MSQKKTKTDTDTSVPKTGRSKRRVKKKSQNDYTSDFSDNSQSDRMTPPPILSTVFGTLIVRYVTNRTELRNLILICKGI